MKIVRKVDINGDTIAFWLDEEDTIRGWWWFNGQTDDAIEAAPAGSGWMATESDAAWCGTTLSALRDELTENPAPQEVSE